MGLRVAGIQLFRQLQSHQPADSRGYVYPEMEFKIIPSETVHEIESDQEHSFSILIPGQCDVEFTVRVSKQNGGMEFKLGRCVLDDSLTAAGWKVYGPALEARIDSKDLSIRTRGYPISARSRHSGKTLEMQKQLEELGYVTINVGGFDIPRHGRGYYSLEHISKTAPPMGKLHQEVRHPSVMDFLANWAAGIDTPLMDAEGPANLDEKAGYLASIGIPPILPVGMGYRRRLFPHEMGLTFQMLPATAKMLGDNPDQALDDLYAGFQDVALDIEAGMLDDGFGIDSISPTPSKMFHDFLGGTLQLRKQAKRQFHSPMSLSTGFQFPRNPNPTVIDENGSGKKRHEPFKRDRFGRPGGFKGGKGKGRR